MWRNKRGFRAHAPGRASSHRPTHCDRVLHRWEASLFGARPWCDESAVISDAHSPFTWHANKTTTLGMAKRASFPHALAVPRWLRLVRALEKSIVPAEGFSFFGARPLRDESAVTSNARPAFTWHADKHHCADVLLGCGETREVPAHARRAALVVIGLRIMTGYCTGGTPLSSVQDRGATCEL